MLEILNWVFAIVILSSMVMLIWNLMLWMKIDGEWAGGRTKIAVTLMPFLVFVPSMYPEHLKKGVKFRTKYGLMLLALGILYILLRESLVNA